MKNVCWTNYTPFIELSEDDIAVSSPDRIKKNNIFALTINSILFIYNLFFFKR